MLHDGTVFQFDWTWWGRQWSLISYLHDGTPLEELFGNKPHVMNNKMRVVILCWNMIRREWNVLDLYVTWCYCIFLCETGFHEDPHVHERPPLEYSWDLLENASSSYHMMVLHFCLMRHDADGRWWFSQYSTWWYHTGIARDLMELACSSWYKTAGIVTWLHFDETWCMKVLHWNLMRRVWNLKVDHSRWCLSTEQDEWFHGCGWNLCLFVVHDGTPLEHDETTWCDMKVHLVHDGTSPETGWDLMELEGCTLYMIVLHWNRIRLVGTPLEKDQTSWNLLCASCYMTVVHFSHDEILMGRTWWRFLDAWKCSTGTWWNLMEWTVGLTNDGTPL